MDNIHPYTELVINPSVSNVRPWVRGVIGNQMLGKGWFDFIQEEWDGVKEHFNYYQRNNTNNKEYKVRILKNGCFFMVHDHERALVSDLYKTIEETETKRNELLETINKVTSTLPRIKF